MASQAQIDANKRNAQRSTGPNTEAGKARAERRAWLAARDYRVLSVTMDAVDADVAAVLDGLAGALGLGAPVP